MLCDCSGLFQLVLERAYIITEFQFLRQTIPLSYCSRQEGVILQTSSCFQCLSEDQ